MTTLTKEDKISVINQHKRNIEYNRYNVELSIIEESSLSSPNQENLDSLKSQMAEIDKKLAALDAELASLG